jgi:DNA-binding CsgD family transcriptional regulator
MAFTWHAFPEIMPLPKRSSAELRMPKSRRESQGSLHKTPRRTSGTLPFTLLSDPTPLFGRDQELEVLAPAAREARKEITARARQQMGDSAYRTAVAEGHALSADDAAGLALLSDRERAVLRLIGEGLPNKQIATALTIGERTVKSYLTSAMNKLGADNRAQAVVAAIQRGLL